MTAEVIIAEIGTGHVVFPTAAHLTKWAGVCPGNNESGGHNASPARTRIPWLIDVLVQARGRVTHPQHLPHAQFLGVSPAGASARRKQPSAVAHSIVVACGT